jgi:futalosine hydrolase
MRLLLVAATQAEIAPLLTRCGLVVPPRTLGAAGTLLHTPRCDVLITGVGQMQCAAHVMAALATTPYTYVVHAGIAGSFLAAYPKRTVVLVEQEALADLGAEGPAPAQGPTGSKGAVGAEAVAGAKAAARAEGAEEAGGWTDLTDMGLLPPDEGVFCAGRLHAARAWAPAELNLPFVRSVTVNRVLSHPRSIAWVRERYAPDIVNMEGAALFYACLLRQVPFVALRAISDQVGPRAEVAWDIPGAIAALDEALERCLQLLTA